MIMVDGTCRAMARGGLYDQLGRRLRPLQRGRRLGGAALREDAVRQRAAARRLHPLVAGDAGTRSASGWSPRPSTGCPLSCGRRRAASRPAWTRTASMIMVTRPREPSTPGTRRSWSRCSEQRTAPGRLRCSPSPGRARSSTGGPRCSWSATPIRTGWRGFARRCGRPASERHRPGRDDKVVAAWNGWLIHSLVQAAGVFGRTDWLAAARQAAELIWRLHWVDGRLRRTSRDGVVGDAPGVLEDYAAMIMAAVALAGAEADGAWLERAELLARVITTEFADGDGYFDTAADAESLYLRPQDPSDNATPSGLSTTVHALALLGEATGRTELVERADRAAATAGGLVDRAPALRRLAAGRGGRSAGAAAGAGGDRRRSGRRRDRGAGPDRVPTSAGRIGDHGRTPGHPGGAPAGRSTSARRPADGVRVSRVRLPAAGHRAGGPGGPALTAADRADGDIISRRTWPARSPRTGPRRPGSCRRGRSRGSRTSAVTDPGTCGRRRWRRRCRAARRP